MNALHALFVPGGAQQEDHKRQTQDEQHSRQPDQCVPVLNQKVGVIRLKIDAVFCGKRLANIAGDRHVGIVKALIGDVGMHLAAGKICRMVVRSGFYRGFGGRIFLSGLRRSFLRLRTGHSFCRIFLLICCDVGTVDVEILPFERIDIFLKGFHGGKHMVLLHNVPPVIRQVLLLTVRILIRFVLIGTFKNSFSGIILHGEEEVAVFAREPLLKILQTCVAVARLLLQIRRIVIGSGSHIAEKCV